MIKDQIFKLLSPRQWLLLLMIGLDGQTVSGYGVTTTFNFPKAKREEILQELFSETR